MFLSQHSYLLSYALLCVCFLISVYLLVVLVILIKFHIVVIYLRSMTYLHLAHSRVRGMKCILIVASLMLPLQSAGVKGSHPLAGSKGSASLWVKSRVVWSGTPKPK